jgi:hypothetical protein
MKSWKPKLDFVCHDIDRVSFPHGGNTSERQSQGAAHPARRTSRWPIYT